MLFITYGDEPHDPSLGLKGLIGPSHKETNRIGNLAEQKKRADQELGRVRACLGLVRLFPIHMDWMRLEKIVKKFELFGIQTHPIPLNPYGLRANRTSP
jgi:hypothetical protein